VLRISLSPADLLRWLNEMKHSLLIFGALGLLLQHALAKKLASLRANSHPWFRADPDHLWWDPVKTNPSGGGRGGGGNGGGGKPHVCTCANGQAATGAACKGNFAGICESCFTNFKRVGNGCVPTTYSVGSCVPTGNGNTDCCAAGYSRVQSEGDCKASYDELLPTAEQAAAFAILWGSHAPEDKSPPGCYFRTNPDYAAAQSKSVENKVICRLGQVYIRIGATIADLVDTTYKVGSCVPDGNNECCATGYSSVQSEGDCKASYDRLLPTAERAAAFSILWGSHDPEDKSSPGCYLHTQPDYAAKHNVPVENKVVCKLGQERKKPIVTTDPVEPSPKKVVPPPLVDPVEPSPKKVVPPPLVDPVEPSPKKKLTEGPLVAATAETAETAETPAETPIGQATTFPLLHDGVFCTRYDGTNLDGKMYVEKGGSLSSCQQKCAAEPDCAYFGTHEANDEGLSCSFWTKDSKCEDNLRSIGGHTMYGPAETR